MNLTPLLVFDFDCPAKLSPHCRCKANSCTELSMKQFSSVHSGIHVLRRAHMPCAPSPSVTSPKRCLWSVSNVGLIDVGPFPSFQDRSSNASSFSFALTWLTRLTGRALSWLSRLTASRLTGRPCHDLQGWLDCPVITRLTGHALSRLTTLTGRPCHDLQGWLDNPVMTYEVDWTCPVMTCKVDKTVLSWLTRLTGRSLSWLTKLTVRALSWLSRLTGRPLSWLSRFIGRPCHDFHGWLDTS